LAAAAAGVSILALAQPVEGKVFVTTKTIHLPLNQLVSLDLNRDGVTDFQFTLLHSTSACLGGGSLIVGMPAGNGAMGPTKNQPDSYYLSALVRGARIGPSAKFDKSRGVVEGSRIEYCSGSSGHGSVGKWGPNANNRYLGVKFLIHGATHYGWIRLSLDFPLTLGKKPSATITAYGYETVANKAIKAGSRPTASVASLSDGEMRQSRPSLGMLALGVEGLPIWRREEECLPASQLSLSS
jgi:hypothetical protein